MRSALADDLGKGFLNVRLSEGFGHCKRPWTCPGFARRSNFLPTVGSAVLQAATRTRAKSGDGWDSLLATSDVLGTGWFAASAARAQPGSTVVVVGDGAVGLMAVLSAKQMGAERIIAMSRHKTRQDLALEYGATDMISEPGDEGVARIKELTKGVGAESVLECVGTKESMMQALNSTRPGGSIGYVGVPHGVEFDGQQLFFAQKSLLGGPAPVRRFLPDLMDLVLERRINPGKVFDLELADVGEGYRAMDERRAIKTLLRV